jgi:hypothetical protein
VGRWGAGGVSTLLALGIVLQLSLLRAYPVGPGCTAHRLPGALPGAPATKQQPGSGRQAAGATPKQEPQPASHLLMSSAPLPLRNTSTSADFTLPALSCTLLASISAKISLWRSNSPRWMYLQPGGVGVGVGGA